ncbi:MAG: KDO2-lipid IV(A) lauroyltransferase [Planctomycetota bacterium]|jgi:KDO2-lipid IV(A) lauroyltransferase|uniref:lysophospholipid acyltransferase family protein n=1 Tax=Patiriisocius sp. Uisw_047 TaxID=3230969 RepID=UPI0039E89B1B
MQRLIYYIIYPLFWILSLLPLPILYFFSDITSFVVYAVVGYRKKVIRDNITLAFPEKTAEEKKIIEKKFYHHLCDLAVESIKSISISEIEINKRFKINTMEVLNDLYAKDKSVLLLCGHYASWEWSGIINKWMPYKGYAVYKQLRNPQINGLLKRLRGRYGGDIVSNKKIVPILFRNKRKDIKSLTLILSDQTPKVSMAKHVDTFMGVVVPVFTGAEALSKKLDTAVVYLKIEKVKRGYYEASFTTITEDAPSLPDYQITRKFLDQVEAQIKEAPAYYLWSHKRWKHRLN